VEKCIIMNTFIRYQLL